MVLENMVFTEKDEEPWSFIDLKMGTNCVLREPDDPKYKLFYDRDVNTTTQKYGFRITGFTIYGERKMVEDHVCEDFEKTGEYDYCR